MRAQHVVVDMRPALPRWTDIHTYIHRVCASVFLFLPCRGTTKHLAKQPTPYNAPNNKKQRLLELLAGTLMEIGTVDVGLIM